jgi:hypothetical protein
VSRSHRILCLLLAATALAPDLAVSQQTSKRNEPGSFLVQLAYLKTEVPSSRSSRSSTCIAVFPDGHFHLEKNWRLTVTVGSGSEMFEGSLSNESLRSLTTILAMDDLKKLKINELPPEAPPAPFETYSETEIVRAVIPWASQTLYASIQDFECNRDVATTTPGWAMEWERSNCTQSTKNTIIKTQVAKCNHGR